MAPARPPLRVAASLASFLVGLVVLAGGLAHIVGVTSAALHRDGLFDTRHTELLLVGWTLVAPGIVFLAAGAAMWRGRAWGYPAALGVGAFLLVEFVLLGSTLGTPDQAVPAYVAAAAYLILVWVAWRRSTPS